MKLVACLVCFAYCVATSAQKQLKYTISLDNFQPNDKTNLPFGAIRILDARYDQNNIGSVVKDLSDKGITQNKMLAVFPEKLNTYLPKLLANMFQLDRENFDTLTILMKQFRIADHIGMSPQDQLQLETFLTISCSFFKEKGGRLTKISSVDDVIAAPWDTNERPGKKEIAPLRAQAVMKLLLRVFQNRNWTATQLSFPLEEAEKSIKKRLQLPVFTDTTYVAGIYKTFEEFKNNSPSIFEFKVGRDRDKNVKEVLDMNGNVLHPKDFWGLSDGKDRYISFQSGLHKLSLVESSFYFPFSRRLSDRIQGSGSYTNINAPGVGTMAVPLGSSDYPGSFRPENLFINMEDGTVHVEEIIGNQPMRKFKTKSH